MAEHTEDDNAESPPSERTAFDLRYRGQSGFESADEGGHVSLFANATRGPVGFKGRVRDPLRTREFLSMLYEIVKSDFRYKPKDRSAYLAWKQQSSRGGVGRSAFSAQREYYDWLRQNDPHAWLILDPIVSAHPDKLMLEVFSKDEGTYARLDIDWEAFELDGDPKYGTTNVDYSETLFDGVQQMREYRDTFIAMSEEAFGVQTSDGDEVIEKHVEVPNSWLHGFLQVQSAATLTDHEFTIAPMDLYNVLRHLRLNADQKGKGRAIRAELTPGERPRLVLEPWELVIETEGEPYAGQTAEVIRVWGRRRLLTLRRLLPYVDRIRVHLIGSGMPGFWVFECGHVTVTMGLTGFTSSNWSQAVHLDVMLPGVDGDEGHDAVIDHLEEHWSGSVDAIAEAVDLDRRTVLSALQSGCRHGEVMYDLADDVYRLRRVAEDGLDEDLVKFRNVRERRAHDLVDGHGGSVEIESENEVAGRGVEYTAVVDVEADLRQYQTKFLLTHEGRVYRADCSCTFFRQHQLKEGPCEHLLALRLDVARRRLEERDRRERGEIVAETRTYVRRHDRGEDVYTLSFDGSQMRVRWGLRTDENRRFQRLMFNDVDEARTAYLARIADLEGKGFMDATE